MGQACGGGVTARALLEDLGDKLNRASLPFRARVQQHPADLVADGLVGARHPIHRRPQALLNAGEHAARCAAQRDVVANADSARQVVRRMGAALKAVCRVRKDALSPRLPDQPFGLVGECAADGLLDAVLATAVSNVSCKPSCARKRLCLVAEGVDGPGARGCCLLACRTRKHVRNRGRRSFRGLLT